MKKRTLLALLLCLAMLASLLAGCGGEKKETEEDGRGDVIESDPGDTLDEPEVNFEDFFGCWEYLDYDVWLYVYGDGTYEMYNADGDSTSGSYTPEGTEIVLDSGERFALDGDGGLIDGEGERATGSSPRSCPTSPPRTTSTSTRSTSTTPWARGTSRWRTGPTTMR